ncbi:hypothetical protein PQR67_37715 [Paraburkholderia fungorum]|uniref:hypothetical protein n=1 Tax=Paraburkholderia fungorum TaxID=134537 RepID=UPI0038B83CCE
MTATERKRAPEDAQFLKECEMELARGASHIASMLYAESIHAAVKETAALFEISHRRDDLKLFLRALAEKLEQRGKPEAVAALQDFIMRGRSCGTEEHGATPSSTHRPLAQKPPGTRSQKGGTSATTHVAKKRKVASVTETADEVCAEPRAQTNCYLNAFSRAGAVQFGSRAFGGRSGTVRLMGHIIGRGRMAQYITAMSRSSGLTLHYLEQNGPVPADHRNYRHAAPGRLAIVVTLHDKSIC